MLLLSGRRDRDAGLLSPRTEPNKGGTMRGTLQVVNKCLFGSPSSATAAGSAQASHEHAGMGARSRSEGGLIVSSRQT